MSDSTLYFEASTGLIVGLYPAHPTRFAVPAPRPVFRYSPYTMVVGGSTLGSHEVQPFGFKNPPMLLSITTVVEKSFHGRPRYVWAVRLSSGLIVHRWIEIPVFWFGSFFPWAVIVTN